MTGSIRNNDGDRITSPEQREKLARQLDALESLLRGLERPKHLWNYPHFWIGAIVGASAAISALTLISLI